MLSTKNEFKMNYDSEADVLYVTKGHPQFTIYVEYSDDIILRFHPDSKELVGFTVIDFSRHFSDKASDTNLPFGINFEFDKNAISQVA